MHPLFPKFLHGCLLSRLTERHCFTRAYDAYTYANIISNYQIMRRIMKTTTTTTTWTNTWTNKYIYMIKKNDKKNHTLKMSWIQTHTFLATYWYPVGYWGIGYSCFQMRNCTLCIFTMIPEDLVKCHWIFICLQSMVSGYTCNWKHNHT